MKWTWRFQRFGLSFRIAAVSLALLLLVQAAVFSVVRLSIEQSARRQIGQELIVGERVWRRLLDQNAQKLSQGASLLAADYGFRSSVSSGDTETIRSALENHGARIGATVTALLNNQMELLAVGEGQQAMALAPVLHQMASPLSRSAQGSQIALVGRTPYQFVMVPMKAPLIIGWVLMGFPINQSLADEMHGLSGVHLAVISRLAGEPDKIVVSTLPPEEVMPLLQDTAEFKEVLVAGHLLMARSIKLDTGAGDVQTLMLRSVDEVVAPFRQVQIALAWITAAGVVLFGLGSVLSARRVTTPLRSLVSATERLGRGDYNTPMRYLKRQDEIGGLAKAFDHMRVSIGAKQAEIRQLAYWDRLTGLPNRAQFRETVQQAIAEHGSQPQDASGLASLAVVMLDLDRFKHVNDVLGYAFGDRLLKAVAERLTRQINEPGTMIARLGGDEFTILVNPADAAAALALAARITQSFEVPLSFEDQTVDLSAGIGIALWPADAQDSDALLSRAEVAMYAAKQKTTGTQLYEPSLDSSSTQTLSLLSELRQAIEQNELRLFLQPKLALGTSRVVAAEALVRWQHPERGLVPPMLFIPFAEQTGFVRQLTLWMFDEAARLWRGLQSDDQALRIAINLSTRDLLDPDFPARLDGILARHQVPPDAFCLEITESAIMDDPQRAEHTLNRLSERGFKLSIDDFGTGYSSLAYLKRLPVDELKIDKSFVMAMEKDEDDAKIVRSTIDLAHNLGLTVVAEGVENATIWAMLKNQGCDEAQGYFMSKPLPVAEFVVWREKWLHKLAAVV